MSGCIFRACARGAARCRQSGGPRPRVPIIWSIVLLTGLILLLTFRTIERGGDGNYFALPLALAILVGGYAALKRLPPGMPTRLLLAMLPLFVVSQAAYSFVSAGWSSGTRAFDFDFTRRVRDLRQTERQDFPGRGHRRHRRVSRRGSRNTARCRLCGR